MNIQQNILKKNNKNIEKIIINYKYICGAL